MAKYEQFFDGIKFTSPTQDGYYKHQGLRLFMHRYVWEYYNGPIADGYEVHHKDFNKANNDIDNLQLLSVAEHRKLHADLLTQEQREWKRHNMNTVVHEAAKAWHKSKEGHEWHVKHGKKTAQNQRIFHNVCIVCGQEFDSKRRVAKYCSGACKQKHRRRTKQDNIKAVCVICGKDFMTNKYRPSLTCGKSCGVTLAWQNGKTGKNGSIARYALENRR